MDTDAYKTIKSPSRGLYKEKGSRFISFAYPVTNTDDIRILIDNSRKDYHDARHHCYAYMLGKERNTWRINDDGEPSGTAGKPILGQINSAGLTNILIIVIRYFGGTLLGVSGLTNAYRTSAADAIINSEVIEKNLHDFFELTFPYTCMNDVMKILKEEEAGQSGQRFELDCRLIINFRASGTDRIISRLRRIENLQYRHIETK
jgi:uncharacterized YigZ family protein